MKNMKFRLLALLLLCTVYSANAQTAQDSLTENLTKLCAETAVPGFAVAVVSKDEIIYKKGFGYADIESKKPYTTQTIQNIGSISKTVIGWAIMKAAEQGKLSLDTPINDILPFKVVHPKYPEIPITVKQLGAHTSGIEDTGQYYMKGYVPIDMQKEDRKGMAFTTKIFWKILSKSKKMPLEDYLRKYLLPGGDFYKKKNFNHKPGTKHVYTNAGAALAALVVQHAVEMPFADYTEKYIFDPLNMPDTGWSFDNIDMSKHASLYHPKKVAKLPQYTLNTFPDGGLLTNIDDLSKWLQANLKGKIEGTEQLQQESFASMMTNYTEGKRVKGEDDEGYGTFWDVTQSGAVGHGGSDPGANSYMYFFPEENVGLVFIANMSMDDSKETIPIFISIWRNLRKYSKSLVNG